MLLSFTWTGAILAPALLLNLTTTTLAVASQAASSTNGASAGHACKRRPACSKSPGHRRFLFTQRYFMGRRSGRRSRDDAGLPTEGTLTSSASADAPSALNQPNEHNVDRHDRVRLTSRWIELDGQPAIPVSGEMQYARVPPSRWEEELRLLAGSASPGLTYVFWIT